MNELGARHGRKKDATCGNGLCSKGMGRELSKVFNQEGVISSYSTHGGRARTGYGRAGAISRLL
jgi:hypothetical protein